MRLRQGLDAENNPALAEKNIPAKPNQLLMHSVLSTIVLSQE